MTVEQVLFLHSRLVEETGGAHGVRDLGLLESAVARPGATFGGEDLYAEVFRKAAALMASLILNHPFVDGNKRTGIAAAALFLARNGCQLMATFISNLCEDAISFTPRFTRVHLLSES